VNISIVHFLFSRSGRRVKILINSHGNNQLTGRRCGKHGIFLVPDGLFGRQILGVNSYFAVKIFDFFINFLYFGRRRKTGATDNNQYYQQIEGGKFLLQASKPSLASIM
jgi:hypothetical protein